MKYYNYHKLIKSDDNDRDNEIYIGKYGEDFRFMKHEGDEGDYFFYSLTLNLYDFYISQKSKIRLIQTFTQPDTFSCPIFNIKGASSVHRICELGETMFDLYNEYMETKSEECLLLMKDIIINLKIFKSSKRKFVDYVLSWSIKQTDEFIKFCKKLRKDVYKNTIYRWSISYENKRRKSMGFYHINAHSKLEAILKMKLNRGFDSKIRFICNDGAIIPWWKITYEQDGVKKEVMSRAHTSEISKNQFLLGHNANIELISIDKI